MTKKICIAGAGPAGLLLAKKLAESGMEVLVYEKKDEATHARQHHWSDALELDMLADAGLPVPEIKANRFAGEWVRTPENPGGMYQPFRMTHIAVYAPDYSRKLTVDADYRVVMTDREKLCALQKQQTRQAGATILFGHEVTGLVGEVDGSLADTAVTGLRLRSGGREWVESADLVVEATGQSASVRTRLADPLIGMQFDQREYGYVYRTVRKFDPAIDVATGYPFVDHFRMRSSEGYSFVHFHDEDRIDIGGGARAPVPPENARKIVMETIRNYPQVSEEEVCGGEGANLKCMPPASLVASGFLVVGHAGAQINSAQGNGVCAGYAGALLAAQILREAQDFSIDSLWTYNHQWFTGSGAHFAALYAKQRFMGPLDTADLAYLMEKNLLNGLLMSHDYIGLYTGMSMDERRRLRDVREEQPALAALWEEIFRKSDAVFAHYMAYPVRWNGEEMAGWNARKEALTSF